MDDRLALPQPDPAVLRKAQKGDREAFTLIVRAYETPVHNYVLRLTGDRTLAEDLTQEVFVRVFNGLPQVLAPLQVHDLALPGDEEPRPRRAPRPRAAAAGHFVSFDDIPPLETFDQPMERMETIDAIWRAVQDLNPDLKMALLLRDVVGMPYNEIADSLEITLATVKWRIFKAREEVQLALAREGFTFADPVETPGEILA